MIQEGSQNALIYKLLQLVNFTNNINPSLNVFYQSHYIFIFAIFKFPYMLNRLIVKRP